MRWPYCNLRKHVQVMHQCVSYAFYNKTHKKIGYCNPRVTRSCNQQVTISAVGGQEVNAGALPTPAGP